MVKAVVTGIMVIFLTILLSFGINKIFVDPELKKEEAREIIIKADQTAAELLKANNLPLTAFTRIFDRPESELNSTTIANSGISEPELLIKIKKITAIESENKRKNWQKIVLKFGLWIIFLFLTGRMLIKNKITVKNRKWFYLTAFIIFGILLGSDPGAMGTIKDAIVLYGQEKVIFPPRLVAFGVFIIMILVINKQFCGWGCQAGTFQDFLFHLTPEKLHKKVPFAISNTIRVIFVLLIVIFAFGFGLDIVESIDLFKIFAPQVLTVGGIVFIVTLLLVSLFIYRPWCLFFCPFGLAGWVIERFSFINVRIDRKICINCRKCVSACPNDAMTAILDQKKVKPDCFICGSCQEICPVKAIRIGRK